MTSNYGTGVDSLTPAHDFEDIEVSDYYGLPKTSSVDENGFFNDDAGPIFEGMNIYDELTSKAIAQHLKRQQKYVCTTPLSKDVYYNIND